MALINRMNAEWVAVARRMSPRVLIELLEVTGPMVVELFRSIEPHAPAHWSVAWAGEETSEHWFDVGRDYTERWLHQQQIRDAVGAPPLTGREWLHPVLALFVRAVPVAYRAVGRAAERRCWWRSRARPAATGRSAGTTARWRLLAGVIRAPDATVTLSDDTAWRLFSKGLKGEAARARVRIDGDQALGERALAALAVMA